MNFEALKEQHGEDAVKEAFMLGVIQGLKQAQEWRPIETAPHGEEVLLGWLGWDGAWNMEVSQASWSWGAKTKISRHGQATHWQPLPQPPREQ